jgi:iron complex outermembrane receptor protein
VPGFTLLDFGLNYRNRIGTQEAAFRLAVENVTNERYWAGSINGSLATGNPRTVLFATSLRF